jgi:hypothetical protein
MLVRYNLTDLYARWTDVNTATDARESELKVEGTGALTLQSLGSPTGASNRNMDHRTAGLCIHNRGRYHRSALSACSWLWACVAGMWAREHGKEWLRTQFAEKAELVKAFCSDRTQRVSWRPSMGKSHTTFP